MFRSYVKIAIRNLVKNKLYSLINVAGLAIGLACFILISIYLKNELSYDQFHEKKDRIYRPVEIQHPPGVGTQHVAVTMGPLGPALKSDFPEIIDATRIRRTWNVKVQYQDKIHYETEMILADPSIFNIFTIPLIKGDAESALNQPNSIVISESVAKKYFGDEDPIGKTLSTQDYYFGDDDYIVTAVMQDYPRNSHLIFNMIAPFSNFENKYDWVKSWDTNSFATYILVRDGADLQQLEVRFPKFINKYKKADDPERQMELYLQPLTGVHLHSGHIVYQTFNHNQGNINNVYIFSIIAIFLLLIASINFMNLSTARSAKRAKEVGIRKVLGSYRKNLIYQFIGESVLISFIALIIALLLAELVLPFFQSLLDYPLPKIYYSDPVFILLLLGISLLVGVIAGSYPAFFLSSFKPVQTLKGAFTGAGKGALLRKVLVVFQFTIALALIVSTGIVRDQMNFIRNKNLGFNKEQVVYLPLRGKESREKIQVLKNELLKNSNILSVSATAGLRGASGSQGTIKVAGSEPEQKSMMRWSYVDFDYLETMEIPLVEGRSFSRDFSSDTSSSVIINEAAVKEFGWDHGVGRRFERGGSDFDYSVIGVVKDFHFYSLRQKIEPMMMWINPGRCNYLVARITPHDIPATLSYIEETWKTHLPNEPAETAFLDEHLDRLYQSELNTGKLFGSFSFLAIFIGSLGLFGLASFTAEQKTKEIGIRKVLGANVSGIVFLLSRDFLKWVALASIIGFPLAWFTMQDWLKNFVYRTDLEITTFILALVIVLLIALLTVSYQAIKAALTNPVKALRYE